MYIPEHSQNPNWAVFSASKLNFTDTTFQPKIVFLHHANRMLGSVRFGSVVVPQLSKLCETGAQTVKIGFAKTEKTFLNCYKIVKKMVRKRFDLNQLQLKAVTSVYEP